MTTAFETIEAPVAAKRPHPPRKLRVAQVITGLILGGGGQVMWMIVRNIDRSRFDLDVYCIAEGGELLKDIEDLGFKVRIIPAYNHSRLGRYRIGPVLQLARELRAGGYDLVHTHLFQADVVGRAAALMAGVPRMVKSLHNMGAWKKWNHLLIDRLLSGRTMRVICCSNHLRDSAIRQEKLPPSMATTIYHGVDIDRLQAKGDRAALLRSLGLDPSRRVIGTIGRPIEEKGHRYLIDAIPQIMAQHPDVQFLIVGEGRLRRQFEKQIANEPYASHVHFVGARKDIPELLGTMDLFVFPSIREGLGIALLEAMAARVPIVASNIPPLTEVASNEDTALLVPPRDPQALAVAINRLLGDAALADRLRRRAFEHVTSSFTERQKVAELEELYLDVCLTS